MRRYDLFGFLEEFLDGSVDLEGNLYVIADVKNHVGIELGVLRGLWPLAAALVPQHRAAIRRNVKTHYDVPQSALDVYLDRAYRSYTCAIFEDPSAREVEQLVTPGAGASDTFDSLEKAQWRKFSEAVELLELSPDDDLLDIGTGYAGLLKEALSMVPGIKVVGWTYSSNQASAARAVLASFPSEAWSVREGDYREESGRFACVASIGMVSHIGPRALRRYARSVRRRVVTGGKYLHHDLMIERSRVPQSLQLGPAFNRKYVWPGFHWYTLGEHVEALERAGFRILGVDDLSSHYAKTTAAWYERMLKHRETAGAALGEAGFRAWQIFLAGISGSLDNGGVRDYRVLCEAV